MRLNQPIKLPNISFDFIKKLKYREKKVPMPKDYIAIDIGSFSLKAIEYDRKDRLVTKILYYPYSQEFINNNIYSKLESQTFVNELTDILDSNGFKSKNILLLASHDNLVMRPMNLPPNIPKHEIYQVLEMSLEDEIPYKLDEVYYDFYISQKTDESTLVHVYASEKKFVDLSINMFRKLRYEVYKIGVPPVASEHAIKANYYEDIEDGELIINVDFGATSTLLSIYDKNRLFLYRVIPYGGINITRAIEKDLSIDNYSAEHFKCENGLLNIESMVNLAQLQNDIFNQVWRSIQYVTSRNRMYVLGNIFLSGGSANLKGLGNKLRRYIEIQTQNSDLMKNMEIGKLSSFRKINFDSNIVKEDISMVETMFNNSIGLALGDRKYE
jgi:type IV pilus assembly protein PilM